MKGVLSVLSKTEIYTCCWSHGKKKPCYSFLIQTIFSGVYRAHLFLFLLWFKDTHPQVFLKSFNSWCILAILAHHFPVWPMEREFLQISHCSTMQTLQSQPMPLFTFFVGWYQCFLNHPHVLEKGSPSGYRPAYADATGICHPSRPVARG